MFRAEFRAALDPPWTLMAPVRVGRVTQGRGTPQVFVTVERETTPVLRVDVYADQQPGPFQEAIVWGNLVVVGFGAMLYLVSLTDGAIFAEPLGGYFGHLYPLTDQLLVADAERISCLDRMGTVLWRSENLGLDGVVVDDVQDGVITGSGEWEPPGGWRPFRLALSSGKAILP